MAFKLIINNVFRLADGNTVFACEMGADVGELSGRSADIVVDGVIKQRVVLSGERRMLNQQAREIERAIETREDVSVTVDEAARGSATLILID